MESNKNNNLPLSLPEELILQILLRLPVKSLVRFKCVSKSWLSLISDPNFAKSHFDLAAAPTHRLLYITRPGFEAQSIDIDASLHDDSAAVSLVSPLPKSYFHGVYGFEILGTCRGFILLGRHPNMFLWNPSTGFHRRLSFSDVGSEFFNSYNYMHLYGFGYDASTDDYLVVVAWIEYGHIDVDLATHLEIFSVRTNSWKEIEGAHIPYMYPSNQCGLLFNGAIHWLAFHDYKSVKVIIAFDLMEKNLSEISLPDGDFTDGLFGNLRMMGGCLSLCYWGNHKTEMWVMKEYKVQSSWTKFEIPTSYLSPICFAKGGELVAMSFAQLMKFNDKGELLECRSYFDDPDECKAAMYIESLLSLPSDFGESM